MQFIEAEGEWRSEILITKRDKAREAVELHRLMLRNGWTPREARKVARHEYAHAKADAGPGIFSLDLRPAMANYSPIGPRSKEELQIIAFAPGDDTSIYDKVAAAEGNFLDFLKPLISKVHSFKLPFRR